jgi:hypothetical protein
VPESTVAETTVPESTVPPTFPAPDVDAALAEHVDDVPGFTTGTSEDGSVAWPFLELADGAVAHPVSVMSADGEIGTLVVVDRMEFGNYVDRLFEDEVELVADVAVADDELVAVVNPARAIWSDVGGRPVIVASVPEVDDGRWVWEHDGRTFIASGSSAMGPYVAALIQAQQAELPSNAHDYGELAGDVGRRRVFVPGYEYADFPVVDALATMKMTAIGDCAERLHVGYVVRAGDPDVSVMGPEDLGIAVATLGGVCQDGGFVEQLRTGLTSQGFSEATVAGKPVWQDASRLVHVDGGTVIQLTAGDPASFAAMRPFVERFIDGSPPQPVVDLTPLPIPTCLYRVPGPPGGDPLDRPSYATDCATPHQGELYHHGMIGGDLSLPYPGDAIVNADASLQCHNAFGPYVGLDYESSRLGYLYFYPSAESWATGDRGVECVLYAGDGEELLHGSLAGTAQ